LDVFVCDPIFVPVMLFQLILFAICKDIFLECNAMFPYMPMFLLPCQLHVSVVCVPFQVWLTDTHYSGGFACLSLLMCLLVRMCCYLMFSWCNFRNMESRMWLYMSLICDLSLLILWVWYFSKVLKYFSFFAVPMISIVSVIVPCVWPVFSMWLQYQELLLFFFTSFICSVYILL
jgi:hypothetical protein